MDNKLNKMGSEPVLKLIISMSLPAMFSMFVIALYNIVDSIFVAQLGEKQLTAVSLAFPIQILMLAVSVGTGIGLNSLISRRLGESKLEEANQAADHGIMLGIIGGLFFAVLGLLFTNVFYGLFTDDLEILKMASSYSQIVTAFSISIFVQINIEKMIQATGNMIYPMIFALVGAVTNIILDPIFIFGWFGFPAMGVTGAAIATVTGQFLSMALSIFVLFKKQHGISVSFKGFRPNWNVIKEIYVVGFPAIIMQSISSVLTMALNAILMSFSGAAVSVLGVYYKLQSFVFMPVFGITQGTMPVMGYNFGAGNTKRLLQSLKISTTLSAAILLAGTVLFWIFPAELMNMFNASAEMMELGVTALRIISISFIFASIGIMLSTLFQAIGYGKESLLISILRQLVVILPVAFILSRSLGVRGVWVAFPVSDFISAIVSVIVFLKIYKNKLIKMNDNIQQAD